MSRPKMLSGVLYTPSSLIWYSSGGGEGGGAPGGRGGWAPLRDRENLDLGRKTVRRYASLRPYGCWDQQGAHACTVPT